jgi:hypothetical protein
MFNEVVQAVVGRELQSRGRAIATGYSCTLMTGEIFPGMAPRQGHETHGVLYAGLDDEALIQIDRFEDDFYERRLICVRLAESLVPDVFAYVVRSEFLGRLSQEAWESEVFRVQHLERFVQECSAQIRP